MKLHPEALDLTLVLSEYEDLEFVDYDLALAAAHLRCDRFGTFQAIISYPSPDGQLFIVADERSDDLLDPITGDFVSGTVDYVCHVVSAAAA